MSDQTVALQPIVTCPKEVVLGRQYDVLVRFELRSPWPYAEDSYQIGVMPSGRGVQVYTTGTTMARLHRDGTCSEIRLQIDPVAVGDAEVWLTLLSQGGVPLQTLRLPIKVHPKPFPTYVNGTLTDASADSSYGINFELTGVPESMRVGQEVDVRATVTIDDGTKLPLWELSDYQAEQITHWARIATTDEIEVAGDRVAEIVMRRSGEITPATLRLVAKKAGSAVLRFQLVFGLSHHPVYADYRHTCTIVE